MEESHGNPEHTRFGAFGSNVSDAAQGNADGRELHNASIASLAARAYPNARRPSRSEFARYDTSMVGSNQHFQGSSYNGSFYDERSLEAAFEYMNLNSNAHTDDYAASHSNGVLTNGHYPSGGFDATMSQLHAPMTLQADSMPLNFSAAQSKQKADVEHQEQAYAFPPHSGKFSGSSGQPLGTPYHPSTASASPFQQQYYVDAQSQMYAPHDQHVGNLIWQHDMRGQPYSVMQPHYVSPQMQLSGFDVPRHRINEQAADCTPAKGASSYIGTPNFHGLENGGSYLNGAVFHHKRNNWLNNTSADSFPSTYYTDSSRGNVDSLHFQQAEKFSHPYGRVFSHQQQADNLAHPYGLGFCLPQTPGTPSTVSYPVPAVGNSVRTIKFAPSVNGWADMDHKINGYGYNHLDIQSNNSLHLDWLNRQFLSSKSEYEPGMQSPQLTYNSVDEVVGRIRVLAKDQNGCCFLQKVLTEGTQEDAGKVFTETIDHIGELMVDPVAHCLVQKIIETCSNDQRTRIICEITKAPVELLKASCNMHGTRVVQKVIDSINTAHQASNLVSALRHGLMCLMTDANGSHVVIRCLQKLSPEHKEFLLETAALRHIQLAMDRNGCCVLQKCIEYSDDDQKSNLLSKIASSARRLSDDQYGNYVIQFILSLKIDWATTRVVDQLEGNFGFLSMQKCGSHVVEHCLKLAPQLIREKIINELMNDPKFLHIMLDQFGNYVIQTALKQCKGAQHAAFLEAIIPHIPVLQNNMYGKRILSRAHLRNRNNQFHLF